MQFESFDNKIKQAAEQHHPNYDETAWSKMEKLLDRHLPQDNDRRKRVIFFLLFFLFLGGGAFLVINKPWKQIKPAVQSTGSIEQKIPSGSTSNTIKDMTEKGTQGGSVVGKDQDIELITEPAVKDPVVTDNDTKESISIVTSNNKQKKGQLKFPGKNNVNDNQENIAVLPGNIGKSDQPANDKSSTGKKKTEGNPSENDLVNSLPGNKNITIGIDNKIQASDAVLINVKQDKTATAKENMVTGEQPAATAEKNVTKKIQAKKANSFFFSFSAGPDMSSVGLDNPGKVKLLTGAGFGYTFHDRWILRTGFYSVSKIYTAKPGEYKTYNPPVNTTYLTKIDADCKVYEIPVSIAYNFSRSEKSTAFAAVGLSSYLMKKEAYELLYTYPGGATYPHTYTYKNENKHYFSVLTLSGGFQRKISKTFAFMVEPYFKIPLSGVGHGKVKLNSAGVLVSLNVSPFNTSVKK